LVAGFQGYEVSECASLASRRWPRGAPGFRFQILSFSM